MSGMNGTTRCPAVVGFLAAAIALSGCVAVGQAAGGGGTGEPAVARADNSQRTTIDSALREPAAPGPIVNQAAGEGGTGEAPAARADADQFNTAAPALGGPAAAGPIDQPSRSESGAPEPAAEATVPSVIEIRLAEFRFAPEVIRVKAGQQVRLEFVNEGKIPHEFVAGRKAELREGTVERYKTDLFAGLPVAHTVDKGKVEKAAGGPMALEIKSGGRATLAFTLPADRAGTWEVGCFLPGHYDAGMKGSLVIE
ncbi:MAG: cupredoxin domain-containing protein [Chloroflexi bacterium]|nr:cupredoxin domain-containing protein [Chloroflexota bacterium]MBI4503928.1 cupredoxin domain-containing protein [Chloroflexota bacterium]